MTHPENSAKAPPVKIAIFAIPRAVTRLPRGAKSPRLSVARAHRALICALAGVAAVLAGTLVFAAPALASGPPYFIVKNFEQEIHSTRVRLQGDLRASGLKTTWQTAYAVGGEKCDPPAEEKACSWIVTNSDTEGTETEGDIFIRLGNETDASGLNILRHLKPATQYYARFFAENEAGKVTEILPFKTLPVSAPEVPPETDSPNATTGPTFKFDEPTAHSFHMGAQIETNGAPTTYHLEYALLPTGPWTVCASGSVSVAEDYADPSVQCTGLSPETKYYGRVTASNDQGNVEHTKYGGGGNGEFESPIETSTAKPYVERPSVRNVTGASAHLTGGVLPHGSLTRWRFESASSEKGPWTPIAGASGAISQAQAEALPFENGVVVGASFPGLYPATTYYVRLSAEDECADGCGAADSEGFVEHFQTSGSPLAATFETHALHGESVRILGSVNPGSVPTSEEQTIAVEGAPTGGMFTLTFKGQTTASLPYNAEAETVRGALNALSSVAGVPGEPEGRVSVTGPAGGPYTVYFEAGLAGKEQPVIEGDGSGLTPSGPVVVAVAQQGGVSYDAHYHFEYEPETEGIAPFTHAVSTPTADAGSGDSPSIVDVDLPEAQAGVTYRYRIVASSDAPGDPVVDGEEQALMVPVPVAPVSAGGGGSCPNEALRTGPSANLPDCRAYEQLTPVLKEGSQEPFAYAAAVVAYAVPGEDGESLMLYAEAVNWGAGPDAGHSPYFFSRTAAGWRMTGAAIEPEFGVKETYPEVFSPDLASFAFESVVGTSPVVQASDVEFRTGPPGGPYTTVATVPKKEVGGRSAGWVAASADSSKLILQVEDRDLVEPASTTKSGFDLYEYSGGALRQVNVQSDGEAIGSCGAKIVPSRASEGNTSSPDAVSGDGSRVFFEAVPGNDCSAPPHLYMRVNGTSTVDLGAVQFLAANETGSEVLVEKTSSEDHEVLLYETGSATSTVLFTVPTKNKEGQREPSGTYNVQASADLSEIYFKTQASLVPGVPPAPRDEPLHNIEASNLYRYDVHARALHFIAQADSGYEDVLLHVAGAEGRYVYFQAGSVAGVPGGSSDQLDSTFVGQLYRYDSAESVVECISCASPFDPEPRLGVFIHQIKTWSGANGSRPFNSGLSANGDFAFFSTPAALVPADVDGETPPEAAEAYEKGEFANDNTSPSSDIYEWRRDGIDGCGSVQGCLALITNGRDGYLNYLIGAADEGSDVFFSTRSQLVAQDKDSADDIYDARVDGGFPQPAPGAVECEGDACSTPASPPNDATPSSLTFNGSGNLAPAASPAAKAKVKPTKKLVKKHSKKKDRKKAKKAKRARNARDDRRAR